VEWNNQRTNNLTYDKHINLLKTNRRGLCPNVQ
jgi:hypothetical protein